MEEVTRSIARGQVTRGVTRLAKERVKREVTAHRRDQRSAATSKGRVTRSVEEIKVTEEVMLSAVRRGGRVISEGEVTRSVTGDRWGRPRCW